MGRCTKEQQPAYKPYTPAEVIETEAEQEPIQPIDLDVLAEIESLEVVEIANTKSVGDLRAEARFNANTGALRGIAFRERNKGRKAVYYVGQRSKGDRRIEFELYANAYRDAERRRIANRGSIGNPLHDVKALGKGIVGTGFDWTHAEGRNNYIH